MHYPGTSKKIAIYSQSHFFFVYLQKRIHMDSKDPKMSPEKYAEMIRKVKKRRDESQGRTMPEPV